MDKSHLILVVLTFIFVSISLIVVSLILFDKKRKKKFLSSLEDLEHNKNLILSTSLISELKKLEGLCNTTFVKEKYDAWYKIYKEIENVDFKKIDDQLFKIDSLINDKKYVRAQEEIYNSEKELLFIKTKSDKLLEDIVSITNSEERNRNAITGLKKSYRGIVSKYNEHKDDYKSINKALDLQFETIEKLFLAFETSLENNEFEEISKIVKAIDDLINNLSAVIEESPTILLLGNVVLPKKINDVNTIYNRMIKNGFNLDYLNLEYNNEEVLKKINIILDKLNVLNIEDSVFELKTFTNYYESIFSDFNKEKESKKVYDSLLTSIDNKLNRIYRVIKNIYVELSNLKQTYEINDGDVSGVDILSSELVSIKDDYKLISDRTKIKVLPFSKIVKELLSLSVRLNTCEDTVELTIKNLSSLKEDEVRARDQVLEIKKLVRDSKFKINSFKFPIVPKNYYVEENEAIESIESLIIELDKMPININVLNIRVDTSRDLALKLLNTSNELVKAASYAEVSIVYGNRYRSTYKEVNLGLVRAEKEFYNGEYRKSLETSLNALNEVETGIHKKILNNYES
ncbi:MAG: septation ring formation regulator EzrA [Bacilli bacterium]